MLVLGDSRVKVFFKIRSCHQDRHSDSIKIGIVIYTIAATALQLKKRCTRSASPSVTLLLRFAIEGGCHEIVERQRERQHPARGDRGRDQRQRHRDEGAQPDRSRGPSPLPRGCGRARRAATAPPRRRSTSSAWCGLWSRSRTRARRRPPRTAAAATAR